MGDDVRWRGPGRWLSFGVSALLIVASIPAVAVDDASAGWNIFLGLLLFGVIASGNRRALLLAGVLTALMAVRLVLALVAQRNIIGAVSDAVILILLVFAWQDLRRQAATDQDGRPTTSRFN